VCLSRNREARLRDVAHEVGITERAVQKIVRDLQDGGYLTVTKQGRCNRYQINRRKTLRHGLESHCTVGKLLTAVGRPARVETTRARKPKPVEPAAEKIPEEIPLAFGERTLDSIASVEKEKEKERKKEKMRASVDTREQGKLF
jgi:Mn-dependent DtxR family transcriptional regulator